MMESGKVEDITGLEHSLGLTVAFTEANGRTVERMERASSVELTAHSMRVNGLMENTMEKANLLLQMARCT